MPFFVIDDLALRWTVTILFAASIAGYLYILGAQDDRWICTIEHLVHLAMSAAMIVMAWPVAMNLPKTEPMVFFLLAAAWFMVVTARISSSITGRLTNGYYGLTMAAAAWMYAIMGGGLLSRTSHSADCALADSPDMQMPGMDTSAPQMSTSATEPEWITTLNWIATAGFAIAALSWLYRYVAHHTTTAVPATGYLSHLGALCQALMADGMAIMFSAML